MRKTLLDRVMYLLGDEDGGVCLSCRECDRGGLPVAYYTNPGDTTYSDSDVIIVSTIHDLLAVGTLHAATYHSHLEVST